jgi:hypothetical protein
MAPITNQSIIASPTPHEDADRVGAVALRDLDRLAY